MEQRVDFSVPPEELSCLLGNLFANLEPPCDAGEAHSLAVCGYTHSGNYARLLIYNDRCTFFGIPEDLDAVRRRVCLERKCDRG